MAFPTNVNIELKTFKSTGVDAGEIVTLKESKMVTDKEHAKHSLRDFSKGAGGSGNGTIEDMKAGGNGSAINGIPVVGGPVVTIDGVPTKIAPIMQDKCRFDHWRTFDRSVREMIRQYGSYYVKATEQE